MAFYTMLLLDSQIQAMYYIQYKNILWHLNMTTNQTVQNRRLCVGAEIWARQQTSLMGLINHPKCEQSYLKL